MKRVRTLLILVMITHVVYAQTRSDVFDLKNKVTWLGLDFTDAKFIGDRERLGSESDMRHLLEAWNELILVEEEKFDVAATIGRARVETSTDITKESNAELDVLSMYSGAEKDYLHLNRDRVEEIISGYNFKGLSGIGLMYNIESFSKLNEEGSMWVTFINMDTKEVLFTERMVSAPKGFGMRNYWAGSFYGVMEKIKKKEFEMWRKKYYRP